MIWCRALVEGEPLHEDPASGLPLHGHRFPMLIEAMYSAPETRRDLTCGFPTHGGVAEDLDQRLGPALTQGGAEFLHATGEPKA